MWILLSNSSLPNLQDKRRLFSYRMERLPIYRCSTKWFKFCIIIFFENTKEKAKFLSKNSQEGVAFLRMRHLFGMNATLVQWKTALSFGKIQYICNMKEIIETMPRIELALIIIGVFVLILGIILGYAMIHEYRIYLDDHYKARYSFRDFIKRERFYIYLFFASIFIFLTNLLYFLEWVSDRMDELALWWILVL